MRRTLVIVICLCSFSGFGQNTQPLDGHLFLQDEVARVDIVIPQDTLALMYEDIFYASEHEFPAQFIYRTSTSVDTVSSIGFRFRGNTSLLSEKKSFKISFNTFVGGGMFHGLEKLNLNGEHNDVSIMRSRLWWTMLRDQGLPGSRSSHVELYINGLYFGLYLNVEHIDEEFVRKRFSPKIGNLYKCLWPADLNYLGTDQNNYKLTQSGRRVYELKTNQSRDDYSKLAEFIGVLHLSSDEDFACEIEKIFNVDDYLKIAALDVLTANWDGYIFNKNNYYLYENPASGRIDYIPYDVDNTFGVDWLGIDWADRYVYDWHTGTRPLFERLMSNPKFRAQFTLYLNRWMSGQFNQSWVEEKGRALQELIRPSVLNDEYYSLDYGFTVADFDNSLISGWSEHIPYGILPYVNARAFSAQLDIESLEPLHVIKQVEDSLLTLTSHLIRVWTEGPVDEIYLRIIEDGLLSMMPLYDDGQHLDGTVGDSLYATALDGYASHIDYQVVSIQGQDSLYEPCLGMNRLWFDEGESSFFINEIMSSNDMELADEYGEYDDWIELFYAGQTSGYLGQLYLTDDIHCPDKWRLPPAFIDPEGFRLIWADKDEEQGPFHASFKLSSNGEELALFQRQIGALRLIDYIMFPQIPTDYSFGLQDDGLEPWVLFPSSTPNASNNPVIIGLEELENSAIKIVPNPASNQIRVLGEGLKELRILTMDGRLIVQSSLINSGLIDLSAIVPGMYVAQVLTADAHWTSSTLLILD